MDPGLQLILAIASPVLTVVMLIIGGQRLIAKQETGLAVLAEQHRQIRESIDALTERVGAQNGRVTSLEKLEAGRAAADRVRDQMHRRPT